MAILTFLIIDCNAKVKKRRSSSLAGLVAVAAVALYLQGVRYPAETPFPAKFFLDRLQSRREHLHHRAALQTDQMIVVSVTKGMLIVGVLVVFFDLLDEAAFDEEGEGPVNGGLRHLDILSPHTFEEFCRGKMTVKGEDLVEDSLPFPGELQAFPVEKLPENLTLHEVF